MKQRKLTPQPSGTNDASVGARFTEDDIVNAVEVMRQSLKQNDVRVAMYILNEHSKSLAAEQEQPAKIHLTEEYLEQLAQQYFPKPQKIESQGDHARDNSGHDAREQ